jgi:hypothetical protein
VGTGGAAGAPPDAGTDAPICPTGKLCGATCIPTTGCCSNSDCTAPQTCGGGGAANVCGCARNPTATTCAGKCGDVVDNCGMTVACGTASCSPGQTCDASNLCTCGGRQCTSICCPPPPQGTAAVCLNQGTQCGVECNPGTHSCGPTAPPCYSDVDVAHCGGGGSACVDCRQANANAACGTGSICANTCLNSTFRLDCPEVIGKPNCSQWDFESGTTEGWIYDPRPAAQDAATGPLTTTTTQRRTGAASLMIPFSGDGNKSVLVKVKLCAGGNALDLSTKSFRASIRMIPAPPPAPIDYNYVVLFNDSALENGLIGVDLKLSGPKSDTWFSVTDVDISTATYPVAGIGFLFLPLEPWTGTIYVDDVRIF